MEMSDNKYEETPSHLGCHFMINFVSQNLLVNVFLAQNHQKVSKSSKLFFIILKEKKLENLFLITPLVDDFPYSALIAFAIPLVLCLKV